MSDADRLRAAAARADRFQVIPEIGNLLRAMADDLEIGLYIVGAESPAAALALADVILGVTDE